MSANMTYSAPNLDGIPQQLKDIPHWVCWNKDKTPMRPCGKRGPASSTNPESWGTFDQAVDRYRSEGYAGVGFVFSGDGIVGVDLDDCVIDGTPAPAALQIMEEIGCQYVELSPSGTGLHGFGYGALGKGKKGIYNGIKTELYTSKRYFTMTGRTIKVGPLCELPGFAKVADSITGDVEKHGGQGREIASVSSVSSVASVTSDTSVTSVGLKFPSRLIPKGAGMRNEKLFRLARYLKGRNPNYSWGELRVLVTQWHQQALPHIETIDFDITWVDFKHAWESVTSPEVIGQIMENPPPLPTACEEVAEYGIKAIKLMRQCIGLQLHSAPDPFFLSSRIAGEALAMDYSDAAKLLSRFVKDGYLMLIKKGEGSKASRYRVPPHRLDEIDDTPIAYGLVSQAQMGFSGRNYATASSDSC